MAQNPNRFVELLGCWTPSGGSDARTIEKKKVAEQPAAPTCPNPAIDSEPHQEGCPSTFLTALSPLWPWCAVRGRNQRQTNITDVVTSRSISSARVDTDAERMMRGSRGTFPGSLRICCTNYGNLKPRGMIEQSGRVDDHRNTSSCLPPKSCRDLTPSKKRPFGPE